MAAKVNWSPLVQQHVVALNRLSEEYQEICQSTVDDRKIKTIQDKIASTVHRALNIQVLNPKHFSTTSDLLHLARIFEAPYEIGVILMKVLFFEFHFNKSIEPIKDIVALEDVVAFMEKVRSSNLSIPPRLIFKMIQERPDEEFCKRAKILNHFLFSQYPSFVNNAQKCEVLEMVDEFIHRKFLKEYILGSIANIPIGIEEGL